MGTGTQQGQIDEETADELVRSLRRRLWSPLLFSAAFAAVPAYLSVALLNAPMVGLAWFIAAAAAATFGWRRAVRDEAALMGATAEQEQAIVEALSRPGYARRRADDGDSTAARMLRAITHPSNRARLAAPDDVGTPRAR